MGAYRIQAHALVGTVFSLEFLFICFPKTEKYPLALGGREREH